MQSMHGEFLKLFQCMQPLYIVICKCTTCHHNVRKKEGNCIVLMKTHPLSRISSCNCRLLPDLSFQRRHILTYLQHHYFAIFLKISLQLFSCRKVKFVQSYTFIETCCWNWNENIGFTFRFLVQAISKHIKGRNYEWMRNSKQSQFVEKEKLQTATTWSKKHCEFLHLALHKESVQCCAVQFCQHWTLVQFHFQCCRFSSGGEFLPAPCVTKLKGNFLRYFQRFRIFSLSILSTDIFFQWIRLSHKDKLIRTT